MPVAIASVVRCLAEDEQKHPAWEPSHGTHLATFGLLTRGLENPGIKAAPVFFKDPLNLR